MKLRKIKNKRGDASEYLTFIVILFFLAVSFLVCAYIMGIFSDDVINGTELGGGQVANDSVEHLNRMKTDSIQNGFIAIFGVLSIGMMVSAFFVRVHPVFFIIYIITLAIAIFTCIPLSNAYQLLKDTDVLAATSAEQTKMNWVMEHLVLITLAVSALSMVILFAKLSGGDTGYV